MSCSGFATQKHHAFIWIRCKSAHEDSTLPSSYLIDLKIFHFNNDLEVSDAWNAPQTMSWVL